MSSSDHESSSEDEDLPEFLLQDNLSESEEESLPIKDRQGMVRREGETPGKKLNILSKRKLVKEKRKQQEVVKKARKAAQEPVEKKSKLSLHEFVEKHKLEIAVLCDGIMANPSFGTKMNPDTKVCPLERLLQIAHHPRSEYTRRLALLSLLAVFKDILPGFRIRVSTEKESQDSASKKVKMLRSYEATLLKHYHAYLKMLGMLMEAYEAGKGNSSLEIYHISTRAMCALILAKPGFNFFDNLLSAIVPRMGVQDEVVSKRCFSCIASCLREDNHQFKIALDVVRIANAKCVKEQKKHSFIDPNILRPFLVLDLKADMKDHNYKALMKRMKAKTKAHKKKLGRDLANQLEEARVGRAEAHVLYGRQVKVLEELFLMYLRILKYSQHNPSSSSTLLPVALAGVARYVHLVNIELAQALLNVLALLAQSNSLSLECSLQACLTVFTAINGPGTTLRTDETEFIRLLLTQIQRLSLKDASQSTVRAVIKCVEKVFHHNKSVELPRVCGYIQELCRAANKLSAAPNLALALVSAARALLEKHPSAIETLLSKEERDSYLMMGTQRSMMDTHHVKLWELSLLNTHFHPYMAAFSKDALNAKMLLPRHRPEALMKSFDAKEGSFNPAIKAPKKRVLDATTKKRRRFKPSTYHMDHMAFWEALDEELEERYL